MQQVHLVSLSRFDSLCQVGIGEVKRCQYALLHDCGAQQVACYLEERVNVGVNFILSGEIDHWKKDYKFGVGMTLGE